MSSGQVGFDGTPINDVAARRRAHLGLSRTFQSLELFEDLSVRDNLLVAAEEPRWYSFLLDLLQGQPTPGRERRRGWTGRSRRSGWRTSAERLPSDLSHGQRKLVGVARALAAAPKLLLLDEPAAGLDTAESQKLGDHLRRFVADGTTIFLIDHDMGLVLNVCDYIYVLDFGRIIAEGTPTQIRQDPAVIARLPRRDGRRGAGPRGARTVSAALPHPTSSCRSPSESSNWRATRRRPMADDPLIEITGLYAGYDDIAVVRDLDLRVGARRGGRPARAERRRQDDDAADDLRPAHPDRRRGARARATPRRTSPRTRIAQRGLAHVAEDRSLFFDLTVDENIRLGLTGGRRERAVAYDRAMALFPALAPLGERLAGLLSGGEQQMLAMARALVSQPKCLLVDEMSLGLAPIIVERLLPDRAPASPTTPAAAC